MSPAHRRIGPAPLVGALGGLMVLLCACQGPAESRSRPAMFRADSARTGVYVTRGVPRLTGVKWSVTVPNLEGSSPVVSDGVVYVEHGRRGNTSYPEGVLQALDAATGATLWQVKSDNLGHSTPAVADGLVFFASAGDQLLALDRRTGKTAWRFSMGSIWNLLLDPYPSKRLDGSPAVADGTVYFAVTYGGKVAGLWSRYLFAVDTRSGREKWRYLEEMPGTRSAPLAVAAGTVYFGGLVISALDAERGTKRWEFTLGKYRVPRTNYEDHDSVTDSPALADGGLYVATFSGRVLALDAATGALRWTFQRGGEYTAQSSPAVYRGTVYIGSGEGALYALDAATGTERWRFKTAKQVNSSPTVADGLVYVGDWDSRLYAVDAKTGQEVWRHKTGGTALSGSAAVHDGVIYVVNYHYGRDYRPGQPNVSHLVVALH